MDDKTQSQKGEKPSETSTDKQGDQSQNPPQGEGEGKSETFDRAYVESLRRESANYRTKLQSSEAELQKFKDAQLSEIDKAKKDATDATAKYTQLEAELKAERVRSEIAIHALGLNIVDADAANKLLDASAIEFDDAGRPKNVKTLLGHLVKDKPYLVKVGGTVTTSPNNPARQGGGVLTKEQIDKMSPAEINANWAAVQEVMKAG